MAQEKSSSFLHSKSPTYSQEGKISIRGIVLNEKGEPIEFANVALLKTDSTFVEGKCTKADGTFLFDNVTPCKYLLQMSYVGYHTACISWSQFNRRVDEAAKGLIAIGVGKGTHVGIWATNVPDWLTFLYACAKIGAIYVTVNTNYKQAEVEYLCENSDMPHFFKATGVLFVAGLVGVAINLSNLYHTYQYSKETMRGKSELVQTGDAAKQTSSGLDRDYITQWSYGVDETLTLLIPNFKGGATVPIAQNKTAMESGAVVYANSFVS